MSLNNNILVVNFFFGIILRASLHGDFSAFIAMLSGILIGIFADEATVSILRKVNGYIGNEDIRMRTLTPYHFFCLIYQYKIK